MRLLTISIVRHKMSSMDCVVHLLSQLADSSDIANPSSGANDFRSVPNILSSSPEAQTYACHCLFELITRKLECKKNVRETNIYHFLEMLANVNQQASVERQ